MAPLTDRVLSSATGFLGWKADRSPRICFGGTGDKGKVGVGVGSAVKEGRRGDVRLGKEKECCSMLPSGGGLGSCRDLREALGERPGRAGLGMWQLLGDFSFLDFLCRSSHPPHTR